MSEGEEEKRAARLLSQARWKQHHAGKSAWIGVDLDATLAEYTTWQGEDHVGDPIPVMVDRVKAWLAAGVTVKVFTARAADGKASTVKVIQDWCKRHVGVRLEVTNKKDYGLLELWDDRAVQVIANTGMRADGEGEPCCYDGSCSECDK